ncbi:MAG: histidine-type phosphatase [Bacteroidales bacterium]|nr:histidine-type phosphatase [Bacteroidales bacterium]
MTKQFLLLALTALLCTTTSAQSMKEEIQKDFNRSASNYTAYIVPEADYKLTPAPKGYEPFYLSHYGRHGSRWLIGKGDFTDPIDILTQADHYGKLTPDGKKTLNLVSSFYDKSKDRLGDLTKLGERQHHGIGKRMTEHFPEIFSGNVYVDARSTVVIRCILSMIAECEELMAFNPKMRIHNDASECYQYYLNAPRPDKVKEAIKDSRSIINDYRLRYVHPERFCKQLFNDQAYVANNINAMRLMTELFAVAANMQSHDDGPSLWYLFTADECYDLWRVNNIDWYLRYAAAPATGSLAPFSQVELLRNFISTADTIVSGHHKGATLRFGHEVVVMPLSCLMELGNSATLVDDLDKLDSQWVNYRIFMMASNIQLVFYRPKKGNGDILVKALLNEREVSLPVKTNMAPYYKWDDLRTYYLNKIDN